jgi:hypothetical protein
MHFLLCGWFSEQVTKVFVYFSQVCHKFVMEVSLNRWGGSSSMSSLMNKQTNCPTILGSWCVWDGTKTLLIQKPGDESLQNAYYNGWLHSHLVSSVYVFVPSGSILACSWYDTSSLHVSYIVEYSGLYSSSQRVQVTARGKFMVNSAVHFP